MTTMKPTKPKSKIVLGFILGCSLSLTIFTYGIGARYIMFSVHGFQYVGTFSEIVPTRTVALYDQDGDVNDILAQMKRNEP